ncbi:MAG: isoprenylcysteine carboxylmethyltransferase family protein [Enterobacterales bacterium]|nr:isoprenylcysteine carboxylmethyltransferase family protein [Enterobacterales bacterium]
MDFLKNKIPPPVIGLSIGLLMWWLNGFSPIISYKNQLLDYFAIAIILVGISIDIQSLYNFIKNKTTANPLTPQKASKLVISGFYRFTRNPMYLGMFLVLLGTALLFGSLASLLLLPAFIGAINYLQISNEEKALETLFGEEYLSYKQRVRRWL